MNQYLISVKQYETEFKDAEIQTQLFDGLVETTHNTKDILLVNYSSSGKGFDEILRLYEQLLDYETGYLDAFVQTLISYTGIESLTDF